MIDRCYNPNCKGYSRYGGRGIKVHLSWRQFENFFTDMGPRTTPQHTLERIDNSKGYGPGLCKWATKKEQARNRRNNRYIPYAGEIRTLAEWAEILNISYLVLKSRLGKLGWSIEKAFTIPARVIRY